MFFSGHWAAAFFVSLENNGGKIQEGVDALGVLVPWVKSLSGAVFGTSAAEKMETLIREGVSKTGAASPSMEVTIRFLVLMVRRHSIRHIDEVVDEIKKTLDRKNGIVHVSAEYAFQPGADFEDRIKDAIRKRTGAVRVEIEGQVKADLIGGYRLKVGDEIIDASVRTQLTRLETCLAAGDAESPPADPKSPVTDGDGGN